MRIKRWLLIILLLVILIVIYFLFIWEKPLPPSTTAITLNNNLTIEYGHKINSSEFMASISDGKITKPYINVNTTRLGKAKTYFYYFDSNNIRQRYQFEITVVDTTPPIIMNGGVINAVIGKAIDPLDYILCGDNADRKPRCEVIGEYNFASINTYYLQYKATDSSNNTQTKNFTLNILPSKNTSSTQSSTIAFDTFKNNYKNDNTLIGIDVSKWQGDINWAAVKDSGVEFVIIRIGVQKGKDGEVALDNYFVNNIKGANGAGIKVGLYFYSYAYSEKEAQKQAKWIIKNIRDYQVDLPIAFDWECWSSFATLDINFNDLNNIALAFIKTLKEAKYEGMLYSSKNYLESIWNVTDIPVWLAHYTSQTTYTGNYFLWQRTDVGRVNGINANVDFNVLYKNKTD